MPTYEQEIEIDEQALDVEWIEHASNMLKYTTNAADAHREMDEARARLDFVRAQLDKQIREDPETFGLGGRLTEGSINSAVILTDEFTEANNVHIEKKYQYEVASAVVKSFEHKKTSLENLVKLHAQSYFAGPSVPHNLVELRREKQVRANRNIGARFTRR